MCYSVKSTCLVFKLPITFHFNSINITFHVCILVLNILYVINLYKPNSNFKGEVCRDINLHSSMDLSVWMVFSHSGSVLCSADSASVTEIWGGSTGEVCKM